jgi:hypothetical protein
LDHLMALKVWDQFGISARWIPFRSGGEALAALLGDQGAAYVGNPRDAKGNPDLRVIAVSGEQRLPQFPEARVFAELGADGLDREFMWRGFAVKKGCPDSALVWYDELFQRITADEQWRSFWEDEGMQVVYRGTTEFTPIVHRDREEFQHYLGGSSQTSSSVRWWGQPLLLVLGAGAIAAGLMLTGRSNQVGPLLIPVVIVGIGAICLAQTRSFPQMATVGAAAAPRLWILLLLPLCLYEFAKSLRREGTRPERAWRTDLVWLFMLLLVIYLLGTVYLGYYLSSAVFVTAAMYLLGVRQPRPALAVTAAWLAFAYVAFARVLDVPLPIGRLWERFF